ncbi:hypothetical protein GQR58_026430 [Nymphon striatum]|nr:hypothetical protein GQR58_026430 [Nymphon striatum]
MRAAAKQQKEQWSKAAALKKNRLEKVKTVMTPTFSSTKARDLVRTSEKAAQMAHRQESKRKAVDKNLCKNTRAAAKQQKEQWAKAAALKKVKTVMTPTFSSTKARDLVRTSEKAAQMAHRQESKRKAVQRLAELAAKRKKISH